MSKEIKEPMKKEFLISDISIEENIDTGIITISGYANRYKDDNGQLIIDRSGESVLPSGYDLVNYKKNPIILYQHDKMRPIGKTVAIELRADGLFIEATVHKSLDSKAYYAVQHGIVKTLSIGFMVKDWQEVDDVWFWTEVELTEVSLVSVPDNADSLFNVLLDSPCNNGQCALAYKPQVTKEKKEKVKEWSDVDKPAMLTKLAELGKEGLVEEAYLIVKDKEKSSTWKFPHHYLDETSGELKLLKGGLTSALSALKSTKEDESHSLENKLEAAKHLIKHYNELLEIGSVDNIPEDLLELQKYFEDELMAKEKHKEVDEEGATSNEQTQEDETINTATDSEEGVNDTQNPDSETKEDGEKKPDGDEGISIEAVEAFIASSSKSSDGLNTLLNLYASLEASINEALPKLLAEDEE